ncbi:MAG: hypothetical protein M1511_16935 [Deltaproteobacteria bacterium]|nr:hypothetical protein [Deltaproteobacteria bacterium]
MRLLSGIVTSVLLIVSYQSVNAGEFGLAENVLSEYGAVKFENHYTKVPTTGKLVSIKITDGGKIFYICREKNGYAIYNLEVRPLEGFKDKIEQDLKNKPQKLEKITPDELLLTKDRLDYEIKRRLNKYSEAVWIRNEIVVPGSR